MTVKQVVNTQPATEKKTNWFKRRRDDKNKTLTIESPSKDSGSFDSTASVNDANDRLGAATASSTEPFMSKDMVRDKIKALGLDFFSKDFEGVTASSIQCLACETTTEQKETMIDLAVPITENMETSELSDSFIQVSCASYAPTNLPHQPITFFHFFFISIPNTEFVHNARTVSW